MFTKKQPKRGKSVKTKTIFIACVASFCVEDVARAAQAEIALANSGADINHAFIKSPTIYYNYTFDVDLPDGTYSATNYKKVANGTPNYPFDVEHFFSVYRGVAAIGPRNVHLEGAPFDYINGWVLAILRVHERYKPLNYSEEQIHPPRAHIRA